jgi:hypothetical protein
MKSLVSAIVLVLALGAPALALCFPNRPCITPDGRRGYTRSTPTSCTCVPAPPRQLPLPPGR